MTYRWFGAWTPSLSFFGGWIYILHRFAYLHACLLLPPASLPSPVACHGGYHLFYALLLRRVSVPRTGYIFGVSFYPL